MAEGLMLAGPLHREGKDAPRRKQVGAFHRCHLPVSHHLPGVCLCQTKEGLLAKSYTLKTTSAQTVPF